MGSQSPTAGTSGGHETSTPQGLEGGHARGRITEQRFELGGRDKVAPGVGSFGHESEHGFGQDDIEEMRAQGAVHRRDNKQSARCDEAAERVREARQVGHVFDDLETGDKVEATRALHFALGIGRGKLYAPARRLALEGIRQARLGLGEGVRLSVNSAHPHTCAHERFGDKPAAAPDIQGGFSFERFESLFCRGKQKREARLVHTGKHAPGSRARVLPVGCETGEGAVRFGRGIHKALERRVRAGGVRAVRLSLGRGAGFSIALRRPTALGLGLATQFRVFFTDSLNREGWVLAADYGTAAGEDADDEAPDLPPMPWAADSAAQCIVFKFGGTSVATPERIVASARLIPKRIAALGWRNPRIAVVVSAMAGETDRLDRLVRSLSDAPDLREYDAAVSGGENAAAALMAIALQKAGFPARSWQAWQLPILTDENHSRARIREIACGPLIEPLERGEIAVIPGFQGYAPRWARITTLGRGGSDTTAVALAVALRAAHCEIYTDVEGVYTADPRLVPRARLLPELTFEEMLELASQGAKVLQTRAAELAARSHLRLRVCSSFSDAPGTLLVTEEAAVERPSVRGLAYSRNEARLTLHRLSNRPGVARAVFLALEDKGIVVDLIVQAAEPSGEAVDVTFTVPREEAANAAETLEAMRADLGFIHLSLDSSIAKLSVVGVGMRSHAGVARRLFDALFHEGINVEAISTSEIRISVLLAEENLERALQAVHTAYGLDAPAHEEPTFEEGAPRKQGAPREGAERDATA